MHLTMLKCVYKRDLFWAWWLKEISSMDRFFVDEIKTVSEASLNLPREDRQPYGKKNNFISLITTFCFKKKKNLI